MKQMANQKVKKTKDLLTEEKIKEAARKVFQQKGYAAAKTRDIAEEAGINLALLNYYFRSKERLFETIMAETFTGFVQNLAAIFNDEQTSLEEKFELLAERYINFLITQPDIPIFIFSELGRGSSDFIKTIPIHQIIGNSVLIKQLEERTKGKINPVQFLINLLGLVIFPFIANPLLTKIGNLSAEHFEKMVLERKKMIPIWMKSMLDANYSSITN